MAVRTRQLIDQECAQAVTLLGQKVYNKFIIDKEIAELNQKVMDLNIEAFNLQQALAAAQEQMKADEKAAQEAATADEAQSVVEAANG